MTGSREPSDSSVITPITSRRKTPCASDQLRGSDLKSARVWAIKENFRRFRDFRYAANARKFFKAWYGWARRSKLAPIKEAAKTLENHFENIITYLRHPITNAAAQALSQMQRP